MARRFGRSGGYALGGAGVVVALIAAYLLWWDDGGVETPVPDETSVQEQPDAVVGEAPQEETAEAALAGQGAGADDRDAAPADTATAPEAATGDATEEVTSQKPLNKPPKKPPQKLLSKSRSRARLRLSLKWSVCRPTARCWWRARPRRGQPSLC